MNASVTAPPFVVFRVDGSAGLGGGPLRRCGMLAGGFAASGLRIAFSSRVNSENIEFISAINAFEIQAVDQSADEADVLRNAWPEGCDLLIVDHYQLDEGFECRCRGWPRRLLVID